MSLPSAAIDWVFDRLAATYGRDWLRKFDGIDPNAVKASWGHELDGFSNDLHAVAYALENLPEQVPNVIQFKAICRRAPTIAAPQLPSPPADPARVAAELAKLGGMRKPSPSQYVGGRDWAHRIMQKVDAGFPVGIYARKAAESVVNRGGRVSG